MGPHGLLGTFYPVNRKVPDILRRTMFFSFPHPDIQDFYGTVSEGLKDKLDPVLFQLPKQLVYSPELLERITGSLDRKFLNAVEFRDPGWWTNHVEAALADHKIMFCGISHPALPDNIVLNTTNVYYRYHGVPKLYCSEYDLDIMKAMAEKLQSPAVAHAYIYFNNTAKGAAIYNAGQFKELIFAS